MRHSAEERREKSQEGEASWIFLGVTTARRSEATTDIPSMSRMTGHVAALARDRAFEGALLVKMRSRLLRGFESIQKCALKGPSLRPDAALWAAIQIFCDRISQKSGPLGRICTNLRSKIAKLRPLAAYVSFAIFVKIAKISKIFDFFRKFSKNDTQGRIFDFWNKNRK